MKYRKWLALLLAACMMASLSSLALSEARQGLEAVEVPSDGDVAADPVDPFSNEIVIELGGEACEACEACEAFEDGPRGVEPPAMAPGGAAFAPGEGIKIESTFPDDNFCSWVLVYCDTDFDGSLSEAEIAAVKAMDVHGMEIASLAGIEVFTALEKLVCYDNKMTELDVTKCPGLVKAMTGASYQIVDNVVYYGQVDADGKLVKGIAYDVGVMLVVDLPSASPTASAESTESAEPSTSPEPTESAEPTASAEPTESAEPSASPEPTESAEPSTSPEPTESVEPTATPEPTYQKIDAATFPDPAFRIWVIENCDSDRDGYLSSLEIAAVKVIDVEGQEVRSTEGIAVFTSATEVNASNNLLYDMDLSGMPQLEALDCSLNSLETLNVRDNAALKKLDCAGNALEDLNLDGCAALEVLDVTWNRLTELDISHNAALRELHSEMNQIKKLDISKCPKLMAVNNYNCRNAIPGGAIAFYDETRTGYFSLETSTVLTPEPEVPEVALSSSMKLTVNVGNQFRVDMTGKTIKAVKTSASIVAVADRTGLVTPRSAGTARITFTSEDKKKRTLSLTVVDPTMPTGIEIEAENGVKVALQDMLPLGFTLYPDTAVSDVSWYSSNAQVASVNAMGVVKPKKVGSTTITATTKRGRRVNKIKIKVYDPTLPQDIAIVAPEHTTLTVGETLTLEATMQPDEAVSNLTWTSSNTKVLRVGKSTGVLEARGPGTSTITVVTRNNKKDRVKITVVDAKAPIEVTINQGDATLAAGETLALTATVETMSGVDPDAALTWSTSNKKVATVSKSGVVTGVAGGTARITVATKNGKRDTITVKVTD